MQSVQSTIDQLRSEGIALGQKLLEEAEERQRERAKEAQDKIDLEWAPFVEIAHMVIPAELHRFLEWPADKSPSDWSGVRWQTRAIQLNLPDANPIDILIDQTSREARYNVATAKLINEEDLGWVVRYGRIYRFSDVRDGTFADLSVAVADALGAYDYTLHLQEEASERNQKAQAEAAQAAKAAEPVKLSALETARKTLDDFGPGEEVTSYLLLSIAESLAGIRLSARRIGEDR